MEKGKFYVYRFVNEAGETIYIGKTRNLESRISGHSHLGNSCYEQVEKVEYVELKSKTEMNIYELYLINKIDPFFNQAHARNDDFGFELPEKDWILFREKPKCQTSPSLVDLIMGVEEASEIWGLSAGYIKNLCAENKIESIKIGRTWVISKMQENPRKYELEVK